MTNINTIIVIDCINAVENYSNFGNYVYLVDSKNDYGIGKNQENIKQMTVECNSSDYIYFWLRTLVPSDMPVIKSMKCDICNIVKNPKDHPGTWRATVEGNGNHPLTCVVTMPDSTEHSFVININSKKK